MPTPISHVALTERIYQRYFKDKDRKAFYIGVCFPDIRRNAGIKRSKTHLRGLNLENIKREKSFNAGFKIHCLIDEISEKYFKRNNIYNICSKGMYKVHSIKIVQDRICYDEINNWDEYIYYLDTILDEELEFVPQRNILEDWHLTLQQYFSKKPNEFSINKLFRRVCYSKEDCDEINRLISLIEKDEKILSKIRYFNQNFESFLN